MKTLHRTIPIVLLSLVALAMVGIVLVRYWVTGPKQQNTADATLNGRPGLVDEQPLVTAQRLAALAVTSEEMDFAHEAVRVADHEVDLTFTSALRNLTLHPPSLTPAARAILTRVEEIQDRVKAEQADIARLQQLLPKAEGDRREALEQELQLEQAVLEVDQEDLGANRQELIRAGGDPRSIIQRLLEQHEAWRQRLEGSAAGGLVPGDSRVKTVEPESRSVIAQFRVWRQLSAKQRELARAKEEVKRRSAELAGKHQAFERAAAGDSAPDTSQPAPGTPQVSDAATSKQSNSAEIFSILKRVAEEQKNLAELDKRIQDLQQLDIIYGNWSGLVKAQERVYVTGLLESALWILAALLLVFLADPLLRAILSRVAPENKRLLTIRTVARFATQAIGIALILLVLFGPPNQLATVVALAGAGLTVALKDFIIGFFGWFALMGRNGIRPGDWVEISGIGGEVLEVGLLHTVLLETGNWSDAGHPTGRKVNFSNSFAIEGHYFNFSTSGQWLWDEIQVPIPPGTDPYPIAEAIQKSVAAETLANMQLAEQEWQRVVPAPAGRSFSASPSISVRPTNLGVNVIVRYITRAQERHEVRSRLYHEIVELLRSKQIPQTQPQSEASTSFPVAR
ncbi:MAG: mechanosensitive ion channel [Acidobacteriia bacterium]|nr:mechanosensitive ion channel [Terriglobia bacterium]